MVQLWCTICISPFCDWSILSDLNMIPAAEKTCKRPPNWTRSVLNEYGPVEHPDRMSCKVECVTTYRYEWSFVVLQRCAGLQIIASSRKRNMLVWCRPRQKITMYLCKIIFITSTTGGCFSPVSVCWLVCRRPYTKSTEEISMKLGRRVGLGPE